jgi:hypothetical protein
MRDSPPGSGEAGLHNQGRLLDENFDDGALAGQRRGRSVEDFAEAIGKKCSANTLGALYLQRAARPGRQMRFCHPD